MRRAVLILSLALVAGSALIWGGAPFGRLALALGQPRIAVHLFSDPAWRGVSFYRAGAFAEAAGAFAKAGPAAAYNLGNAQAQQAAYAAALESYDLAMAYREDPEAQANFDLVRSFYTGTRIDPDSIAFWGKERIGETVEAEIGRGAGRAAGTGEGVTNTGATVGLPALQSRDQIGVRKVFDDSFVLANPRWLVTLEDVPGAFLAARLSHEYKRRKKAGQGQPEADNPW
jgi:Ca-activated chloride channel family protein